MHGVGKCVTGTASVCAAGAVLPVRVASRLSSALLHQLQPGVQPAAVAATTGATPQTVSTTTGITSDPDGPLPL